MCSDCLLDLGTDLLVGNMGLEEGLIIPTTTTKFSFP